MEVLTPDWRNPNWNLVAVKKWLLATPLFKWAYRQGGIDSFSLAHKDILETMQDDLDAKAEELAKRKLNDLLIPVDMNHVVSFNERTRKVYIGSQEADEGTLGSLKTQAELLLESELWQILYETPKQLAHKALFTDPGDLEVQRLKGRAMLYLLETQKKIVETFKGIS